ncbi:TIGR03086 family metal-binding protein [Nocardia bovistercoris]|uniref:TIGR03086 family protein n=1 Tax=Nocardia bovistercoris TaxID=2785916 RepID=A0A931IEL2_9NOCA|nr:TIGR03086 family metal-binding protein [Nocardia bovistercoris]MBH0778375.1 TIGR03086 family protein [Nocardia bovistercoris]
MTANFDLEPAATALAAVVAAITDDQLTAPTPCADTTVRDLLAHVVMLTEAFRQAATKEAVGRSAPPGSAADIELPADWRTVIPTRLKALVEAWREPGASDGDTEAGGVALPAAAMAVIALDEVVVHGWDLARATGSTFTATETDLTLLLDMLKDTPTEGTPGMFGPVLQLTPDAPLLARVLALTGRNATWPA